MSQGQPIPESITANLKDRFACADDAYMFCSSCGASDQVGAYCEVCGQARRLATVGAQTRPVASTATLPAEVPTPRQWTTLNEPSAADEEWAPPVVRASPLLGLWLEGAFWGCAAVAALGFAFSVKQWRAFEAWWAAPIDSRAEARALSSLMDAEGAVSTAVGLLVLGLFAAQVLLIIWSWRGYRYAECFGGATHLRFGRGWTIGGWFIPIANLVVPHLVLSDLDRMSGGAPPLGSSWRGRPVSPWLWVSLVGFILMYIAFGVAGSWDPYSAGEGEHRMHFAAVVLALVAAGAMAASRALWVRRVRLQLAALSICPTRE